MRTRKSGPPSGLSSNRTIEQRFACQDRSDLAALIAPLDLESDVLVFNRP